MGGDILTDIAPSSLDKNPRDIVSKHETLSTKNLIAKLRGRGRKRKRIGKTVKPRGSKMPRLTKRDFLQSFFSQCSIALKGLTIIQAAELNNYLSFFETILTYGSDAATSHLRNAFWYLDNDDLLPCEPTAADAKTKASSRDGTVLNGAKMSKSAVEFTVTPVMYSNI